MIQRDLLPDGTLRLHSRSCSYTMTRLFAGTLFLVITGEETGELGRAPLGEVAVEAALHPPLRLLIDMTGLTRVAGPVSDDWTAWFKANQNAVGRVDVLVNSTSVRLTVAVSQLFSRTGNMIRIHTDVTAFEAAVRELAPTFDRSLGGALDSVWPSSVSEKATLSR